MVVALPLVLEGQSAVRDVVKVLEPLEERHGHTTSVDVQVGDHQDVAVDQDLVSSGGCGSVGGLGNDLQEADSI